MREYLEAGKIANTHGIGGDVTVESYCDSPEVLAGLQTLYLEKNGTYLPLTKKKASIFKGRVIAHFDGIDSFEDAIALKGKLLFVQRGDIRLGEGDYFVADLIGLPIIDEKSGEVYGKLSDVLNYGAGDIYELVKKDGTKALIPAVGEFVKRTDLASGIYVSVIEGLI